jgi:molybdopterin molybdotransferase
VARTSLLDAASARRLLREAWPPLATEVVALTAALGRVLGERVISREDLPAFARSAMDGYAVRAAATAGATAERPLALALGRQAFTIATGGPVPDGTDAVVMVEQTTRDPAAGGEGTQVLVHAEIAPGRNVVPRGDDVQRGAVLADAGHRLTPRDLALLAAVGTTSVTVKKRPRVAVISTGAELVPPHEDPPSGRVRDINQVALCAALESGGALADPRGIVPDDPVRLAQVLAESAKDRDLVLITGGTSVGTADHTAAALRLAGARPLFHGLAIRPGRPTLAAQLGSTLVVGLPGVPSAAAMVFEIFLRPLLDDRDRAIQAHLAVDVGSTPGREDYVRVQLESRADGRWATPVAGGASSLRALATAAGVAIVPADVPALTTGASITVLLL